MQKSVQVSLDVLDDWFFVNNENTDNETEIEVTRSSITTTFLSQLVQTAN